MWRFFGIDNSVPSPLEAKINSNKQVGSENEPVDIDFLSVIETEQEQKEKSRLDAEIEKIEKSIEDLERKSRDLSTKLKTRISLLNKNSKSKNKVVDQQCRWMMEKIKHNQSLIEKYHKTLNLLEQRIHSTQFIKTTMLLNESDKEYQMILKQKGKTDLSVIDNIADLEEEIDEDFHLRQITSVKEAPGLQNTFLTEDEMAEFNLYIDDDDYDKEIDVSTTINTLSSLKEDEFPSVPTFPVGFSSQNNPPPPSIGGLISSFFKS